MVTAKLADGSVLNGKIADGSVTGAKLADGSVGTGQLADGSVTGAKILDDTVGAADLAPNSVVSSELADDAVDTFALQVSSVDTAALQNGAVTGQKTNEPTLDIPTAWAKISDGAGNGADPILVDSEGVTAVNDGPNPGTDGVTCYDLANGFTPDLILAQSRSTTVIDAIITAVAPVTPGLGCVAGDEAQVQPFSIGAGGIRSADLYVAFFDLH